MSRKSFEQTLEFIEAVDRARTYEDVCGKLLEIVGRFGIEHVLAGTLPQRGSSRREQRAHVVLDHWPHEWSRRYFSHDYIALDPAIARVRANTGAFLWSELEDRGRLGPLERRIMGEAGEFGLRNGFTVPLVTLEGDISGFSFAGERIEVCPTTRGMLTLLATYALARGLQLGGSTSPTTPDSLSDREREALQWAAEGKTECEISDLMRISQHGVDKHMRAARRKLGTRNRTHAVAEALRMGILR